MKTSGAWAGRVSWHQLFAIAGFVACAIAPAHAAETYPARPIRMIVPIAAGGGTDTMSEVMTSSPAEFGEFIRKEVARWREVIQKTGIRED